MHDRRSPGTLGLGQFLGYRPGQELISELRPQSGAVGVSTSRVKKRRPGKARGALLSRVLLGPCQAAARAPSPRPCSLAGVGGEPLLGAGKAGQCDSKGLVAPGPSRLLGTMGMNSFFPPFTFPWVGWRRPPPGMLWGLDDPVLGL